MDLWELLLLPLVGAIIGYVTNKIAIWMLFHPYREYHLAGIRVPFTPGLIPKRKKELMEKIAETVEREMLSSRDFFNIFREHNLDEQVNRAIDSVLDKAPLLRLIPNRVLARLRSVLAQDMVGYLDQHINRAMDNLEERVDVRIMILKRLEGVDLAAVERMILNVASDHLRQITYFGGLLGFLIGLAQVLINIIK